MTGILNLLAGAVGVVKDTYFNLVTLLLPGNGTNGAQNNTFLDSSTNNFTITRNGNTTQGTFSPFSQTGWSNYFNGSTDYLTTPDAAQFDFGTGDFTIEFFVYIAANSGLDGGSERWAAIITSLGTGSGVDSGFGVYITGNGSTTGTGIAFENRINSTTNYTITATTTVNQNAWNHIAVARSGTTTTIYLNGTSVGSGTLTNQTITSSQTINIGRLNLSTYTRYLNGYLSNLRVVKGTAVYTSSFTVPTTALTNITNTSLLTCQSNRFVDNSSNAFAITVNGTPSVQAFSPFAPTAAYSAATNGGSGYFDGTGDFLTVADNVALRLGTSAYTVEFWWYPNSSAATQCFLNKSASGDGSPIAYYAWSDGKFHWANSPTDLVAYSYTVSLYQWYHVAFVRTSTSTNDTRLYINGTLAATYTDSIDYTNTGTLNIACQISGASAVNGYFTNFRMVKGSAIAPPAGGPTSPLTAVTNTSLLLNFTNAGITDATAKNDLETVGNAQISTTQSKFGGSSMYFDGTGDYLLISQNNQSLMLGTAPFTIEFWFNTTSSTQYAQFVGNEATTNGFSIMINVASATAGTVAVFNGASGQIHISTSSYRDGAWHHFALSRDSSGSRMFIDGTQIGSTNTGQASTSFDASSFRWAIGANLQFTGRDYAGYIDDLRVTKGYARYTSNFTAPTAAFALQ